LLAADSEYQQCEVKNTGDRRRGKGAGNHHVSLAA
jgi:hypothetical protein